MSLYVNFNNPAGNPYQWQATTTALNEEGGQDQPRYTSQAVGEEGGDRGQRPPEEDLTLTTLAVGEEGGQAGFQTNEILNILQKADGGPLGQGDGQLTPQELDRYAAMLNQQIAILKGFDQAFPWLDLGGHIKNLERQADAARFMKTNFGTIAGADGNAASMTANDVRETAARDGNADDISQYDVLPYRQPSRPQNTIDLMRLAGQMDANRDGQLSRQELDEATGRMQDRLRYLESIRTLVYDPRLAAEIAQLRKDVEAADLLRNNYERIAGADARFGGNANTMSQLDIMISAARDGNIFQLDPMELPMEAVRHSYTPPPEPAEVPPRYYYYRGLMPSRSAASQAQTA